ncbi:MAG: CHASE3 domain-containing protein [Candidatus Korobacteraceae bacterium]|jgi:PAS domain S-box-containing protein
MRNDLKPLWLGIVLLLIVLTINGYVTFLSFQRVNRNNALVEHSQQVLLETERLKSLMVDAETGQRGYLYTGDLHYLEPYNRAAREVDAQLDRVAALTADIALQRTQVQQLRDLSHAQLKELADTIAMARAGQPEEAKARVLSNGKNVMDDIRASIAEIEGVEARLRANRMAEMKANTRSATLAFVIATSIAAAALLVFGGLLTREMRKSDAAAAAVLEQKEWLDTTLRSIGDAVLATDTSGRVVFLNEVAATLTGHTSSEARHRPLRQVFAIFNEVTREPAEDPVAKVVRTGAAVGLANHTVLRRADGTEVAIDDSAAPIRNAQGELIGVVLVFRDVSKQRAVDAALRNAEKLATAGRFAATIAHEINNPLEAIMNLLFLLNRDSGLSSEGRGYLSLAEQELNRVAAVARQTLAFYKDNTSPAPVNISNLLDEILAFYGRRIEARKIHVIRNYRNHSQFVGSAGEIRQVFSNLILNSIDALPPDGVLTLNVSDDNGGRPAVRVEVEDNGSGIQPDHLSKIFEPFFTTKKDVGTGLGLWSAKNLVEKHEGQLLAECSGGKTRLTVLLPVLLEGADHAEAG